MGARAERARSERANMAGRGRDEGCGWSDGSGRRARAQEKVPECCWWSAMRGRERSLGRGDGPTAVGPAYLAAAPALLTPPVLPHCRLQAVVCWTQAGAREGQAALQLSFPITSPAAAKDDEERVRALDELARTSSTPGGAEAAPVFVTAAAAGNSRNPESSSCPNWAVLWGRRRARARCLFDQQALLPTRPLPLRPLQTHDQPWAACAPDPYARPSSAWPSSCCRGSSQRPGTATPSAATCVPAPARRTGAGRYPSLDEPS